MDLSGFLSELHEYELFHLGVCTSGSSSVESVSGIGHEKRLWVAFGIALIMTLVA